MTWLQAEQGLETGAPFELYRFAYAGEAAEPYRYTNAEVPINGPDGVYQPVPISRDSIRVNGKMEKTDIVVSVPVTLPLANLFLPYPPPGIVRLVVRAGHRTDMSSYPIVWLGRVLNSAREGNQAKLTCENTTLSLKRSGNRRVYQHGCSVQLYGSKCKVNKGDFEVQSTVAEMLDGGRIRLPDNWFLPFEASKFRSGTIEWLGSHGREVRTILRASSTTMAISGFLTDLEEGKDVWLYPGCAHNMSDCKEVFDNIVNYRGEPWIPFKNPVKQHPYW